MSFEFESVEKFVPDLTPFFTGERNDKAEATEIRICLANYLGELVIKYDENAEVFPYTTNFDQRKISGIVPLTVEEFVIFMLYTMPLFLEYPVTSFVRDFVVKWVERSPISGKLDRVTKFLDQIGVY